MTENFENTINSSVDDNIENLFGNTEKVLAKMTEQGTKSAIIETVAFDSNNNLQVNLNTSLSKNLDSIDVGKMSNGGTTLAHNAITATTTSTEIDCRGFKNVRVSCEVTAISSATWTPSITGSENSGGTFGSIYRDIAGTFTAYSMPAQSVIGKNIYVIQNIPNFIKITETLAGTSGTVTVKVTPFN